MIKWSFVHKCSCLKFPNSLRLNTIVDSTQSKSCETKSFHFQVLEIQATSEIFGIVYNFHTNVGKLT